MGGKRDHQDDTSVNHLVEWRGQRLGDKHDQSFGRWLLHSFRYWWPRERRPLLKMLIALALVCMATSITINAVLVPWIGIVHEAEHRVWQLAPRAFAALHDQIRSVFDDQIWRQAMTEKLLTILVLVAGVLLHAALSYREIKEWVEQSIGRTRERYKEKKYSVLAKAAGITGAILIAVPVYTILSGGMTA